MDAILNNRCFTGAPSDRVRQCMLHGTAIPCTKPADVDVRPDRASSAYDGDIYPVHEGVDNDANPLAHHSGSALPSSVTKGSATSLVPTGDPNAVYDQNTVWNSVGVDFSLSGQWRRIYCGVAQTLWFLPIAHEVKVEEDNVVAQQPVQNITLGGAALLLGVAGSFAAYAYHATQRKS
jgi:hypothetical protein